MPKTGSSSTAHVEAPPDAEYLTVSQFHHRVGHALSKVGIYHAVRTNTLPHVRIGKKILIAAEVLKQFEPKDGPGNGAPAKASDVGFWEVRQATEWSGLGPKVLRDMVAQKRVPFHRNGSGKSAKILFPIQGFKDWFNRGGF